MLTEELEVYFNGKLHQARARHGLRDLTEITAEDIVLRLCERDVVEQVETLPAKRYVGGLADGRLLDNVKVENEPARPINRGLRESTQATGLRRLKQTLDAAAGTASPDD